MRDQPRRIVSFLPSATEMVFALGLGDQLAGVTHECDYPPEAKNKPIIVRSVLEQGLTQREIDDAVSERLQNGVSLYEPDEQALLRIEPDLILTQNLCSVCAPSGNEISRLLQILPHKPQILWLTPKSLTEIFGNIREVGEATHRSEEADALIEKLSGRIAAVAAAVRDRATTPRVFCMEWIDPLYCSGHWVPEMVRCAGGVDRLGRAGRDSVRISWEEVQRCAPEIIVVMPCGFDLEKATAAADELLPNLPHWGDLPAVRSGRVYAVDANAYFARPGPRVVDGIELLAHLIHPDHIAWNGPPAYRKVACP
jgi:iron complex transport system substrate-binding protein